MAVQGWHTNTVTTRMGRDNEESWDFVMREADRAEQAARHSVQKDWELQQQRQLAALIEEKRAEVLRLEQERRDEEHAREEERLRVLEEEQARREASRQQREQEEAEQAEAQQKEDEEKAKAEEDARVYEENLDKALYDLEKEKRDNEVKTMMEENHKKLIEEGDHRVAQWYAHRDAKMRFQAQRTQAKAHMTLEEERALLGFRTQKDLRAGGTCGAVPVADKLQNNAEQKLTAAHFWAPEDLIGRPMEAPSAPPSPPSTAPPSNPPSLASNVGTGIIPPAPTPSPSPAEAVEYPERTAQKWGKGMGLSYSGDRTAVAVPQETVKQESETVDGLLLPPHMQSRDWEKAMRDRVHAKKKAKPPTTDQLLRQHYNRVLNSSRVPGEEDVATARRMTNLEEQVWERRNNDSALGKLLRSRQEPPRTLKEGAALRNAAEQTSFPALDRAEERNPKILKVTAPVDGVSGLYFARDDSVFASWGSYAGHCITLKDSGWVITLTNGDSPIKSDGPIGAMPHEVQSWLLNNDLSPEITVVTSDGSGSTPPPSEHPSIDAGSGQAQALSNPPSNASHASLPPDSVQRTDPSTSTPYYYNVKTQQSVWTPSGPPTVPHVQASPKQTHPLLMSGDWIEKNDPKSGQSYYVNAKTRKTTWSLDSV